jgi:TfoX/Sxy family transcriptional regulator of competence genes
MAAELAQPQEARMTAEQDLADRLREILGGRPGITEKRIVGGGIGFLADGKLLLGARKDGLLLRGGPEPMKELLEEPNIRPMRFGEKQMAGYVLVEPAGIDGKAALKRWVERAMKSASAGAEKGTEPMKASRLAKPAPAVDSRIAELIGAFQSDPRLAAVAEAFETSRAEAGKRKFGSNGLKANGKLFALFTQGTLVVKLPKDRVSALVAQGSGEPFDPGHGRLMKEWLKVTSARAAWIDLAKEAHDHVRG